MAQLPSFKRIIAEDFDQKDRSLVSKLAYSINIFAENVLNAFDNNITIADNLSFNLKTFTVTVDVNGNVVGNARFQTGLANPCQGIVVIKSVNLSNSIKTPSGTPFLTFSENSGTLTIGKVTNLTASNQYQLTLLLF